MTSNLSSQIASLLFEDEGSTRSELSRRLNAALAGLRNTELESALGNLAEEDYRWLRQRHLTEAALIMKAMESEDTQAQALLLSTIDREVAQVRLPSGEPETGPGPRPSEEPTVE